MDEVNEEAVSTNKMMVQNDKDLQDKLQKNLIDGLQDLELVINGENEIGKSKALSNMGCNKTLFEHKRVILQQINDIVTEFNATNQDIKNALKEDSISPQDIKLLEAANDDLRKKCLDITGQINNGKSQAKSLMDVLDSLQMDTIPELNTQIRVKNEAIQNSDAIFEELKDKLNR